MCYLNGLSGTQGQQLPCVIGPPHFTCFADTYHGLGFTYWSGLGLGYLLWI